jgi:hypothetical protein
MEDGRWDEKVQHSNTRRHHSYIGQSRAPLPLGPAFLLPKFGRLLRNIVPTPPNIYTGTMTEAVAPLTLPKEFDLLSKLVGREPETLAAGNDSIRLAALAATKYVFDLCVYLARSFVNTRARLTSMIR